MLSVLLEHAAYVLHQVFELPHPLLAEATDAFLLYVPYDPFSKPAYLPPSLRHTYDLGPAIFGVGYSFYVTCFLEPVNLPLATTTVADVKCTTCAKCLLKLGCRLIF